MPSLFAPLVRQFGDRYGYDTSYLETMDRQAPGTLWRWLLVGPLNRYAKGVPAATYFAAMVVATRTADCGPCLRLVVNMAVEAGVDQGQLVAALRDNKDAMSPDTALGSAYARAVTARDDTAAMAVREQVVDRYGERALPPLALAIAFGGFYQTLKRGLGAASSCQPVLAELEAST